MQNNPDFYLKKPMRRLILILFAVAALLVGMAVASGVITKNSHDSAFWVAHTKEVIYAESELLSTLQDMLLSSRGYLLEGNRQMPGDRKMLIA